MKFFCVGVCALLLASSGGAEAPSPSLTTYYLGTVSGLEEVKRSFGTTITRKVERNPKDERVVSSTFGFRHGQPTLETLDVDLAAKTAKKSRRRGRIAQDIACQFVEREGKGDDLMFVVRCTEDDLTFVERHTFQAHSYLIDVHHEDAREKRQTDWTFRFEPTTPEAFTAAVDKQIAENPRPGVKSLEDLMDENPASRGKPPEVKSLQQLLDEARASTGK